MVSLPPRPLTVSLSIGALGDARSSPSRRGRSHVTTPPLPAIVDGVVAGGAVDDDLVGLAVAARRCRRAPDRSRPAFTSVPVRSLTTMLSAPPKALNSMCSTPLRSIVMLPTSREKRTRAPLAEMSMFSLTLAPLNSSVSVPAWPSTVSLPSPGFQTNVSSPAPRKATSLPRPPMTTSLPSPPSSMSAPWLPMIVSLPAPPSSVRLIDAGRQRRRIDGVVAAEAVDDERVVGTFGAGDRHLRRQARDGDRTCRCRRR